MQNDIYGDIYRVYIYVLNLKKASNYNGLEMYLFMYIEKK